jgi:hypothetical protein
VLRNLPVANGWLLEVHMDASKQAVIDYKFAAIADIRASGWLAQ